MKSYWVQDTSTTLPSFTTLPGISSMIHKYLSYLCIWRRVPIKRSSSSNKFYRQIILLLYVLLILVFKLLIHQIEASDILMPSNLQCRMPVSHMFESSLIDDKLLTVHAKIKWLQCEITPSHNKFKRLCFDSMITHFEA